ncbi:MAG: alpha/beta hydrolase [Myxococcota bacterium]
MSGFPTLVLLPGLDGTGENFGPFVRELGAHGLESRVVRYRSDRPCTVAELRGIVEDALPDGSYLLVAESFSGPLGIEVAARGAPGCVGLVLVATFHRFPRRVPAWIVRTLGPLGFAIPPPRWALRGCSWGMG